MEDRNSPLLLQGVDNNPASADTFKARFGRNCGMIFTLVGNLLFRGLMFCGTLGIEGWLFNSYFNKFTKYQLEEEGADKTHIYLKLSIVAFLSLMQIICLLRLTCSNPGFVKDYFKSRKVEDGSLDYQRFEVYRKEDFPGDGISQGAQPIATVQVRS